MTEVLPKRRPCAIMPRDSIKIDRSGNHVFVNCIDGDTGCTNSVGLTPKGARKIAKALKAFAAEIEAEQAS